MRNNEPTLVALISIDGDEHALESQLSGAVIKAADITELRLAIDALVRAQPAVRIREHPSAGGRNPGRGFLRTRSCLNVARAAVGTPPFAYTGVPAPAPGGIIYRAHIEQLREALR